MAGEKERRAKGLCWVCIQPAEPGMSMCARHLAALREKNARRAARAAAAGLCRLCLKRPPIENRRNCRPCLDRLAEHMKKRAEQLAAHGMCRECGLRLCAPQRTRCAPCLQARNEQRRRKLCGGQWLDTVARDQYRCRLCGHDRVIRVHHIDGRGETSPEPTNNEPSNLVTLCLLCHDSLERLLRSCQDLPLLLRLLQRLPLE